MTQFKRSMTLSFSTRGLGRLTESEIVKILSVRVNTSDIRAIQTTEDSCRVTTASIAVKQQLALPPLTIKDKVLTLSDVCRSVTNVTVKDAPYEMLDDEVIAALADYGNVVEGSIRRGKVKHTNIENGTRYLALDDAKKIIPGTLSMGEF